MPATQLELERAEFDLARMSHRRAKDAAKVAHDNTMNMARRFRQLNRLGYSKAAIAREMGLSRAYVSSLIKRAEEEIEELKARY